MNKQHLLFINLYYHPDLASTGQLLTQLTESLSDDYRVTVVCGFPSYTATGASMQRALFARQRHGQVEVLRVFTTRFARHSLVLRAMNYLTFFVGALIASLLVRRVDLVVVQTDPPFVGIIGWLVKKIRCIPLLVIFQDLFPEVGVVLKKLPSVAVSGLRFMRKRLLLAMNAAVVISKQMQQYLLENGVRADKLTVVANWVDTQKLQPQVANQQWRQQQGLDKEFIVMHSGNVGLSQQFEWMLDAAWYLSKWPITIVLVGEGARRTWLAAEIRRRSLTNIRLLPYQSAERLAESLSAADLHLVTLRPGLERFISPSKVFGIMAVARPFVAMIAENSEVYEIIDKYSCGMHVQPALGPKGLAQAIQSMVETPDLRREMGERGRQAVCEHFSRQMAVSKYKKVITQILQSSSK